MMNKASRSFSIAGAVIAVGIANMPLMAAASVVIGTTVSGDPVLAQWEDPVFIGSLLDGASGAVYPPGSANTTATAVYNLGSSLPAASTTISWGDYPGAPGGVPPSSTITFTGIPSIPATKGTVAFPIGSFSYTNGTSLDGSQIYGATLGLYARGTTGNIPIGSIVFKFTATVNDGTAIQNADYLNVVGISGSFNVLEGATASASVYGTIIGDPQFIPSYFQLDAGQNGGFIGSNLSSPVPELSTWTMMLFGFAGIGLMYGQKRRKPVFG